MMKYTMEQRQYDRYLSNNSSFCHKCINMKEVIVRLAGAGTILNQETEIQCQQICVVEGGGNIYNVNMKLL